MKALHISSSRKTPLQIALVKTTKGDIVLIPPGYEHITINPSAEETHVVANLVSTAFVSPPPLLKKSNLCNPKTQSNV